MSIKTHFSDGEWKRCTAKEGNCPLGVNPYS